MTIDVRDEQVAAGSTAGDRDVVDVIRAGVPTEECDRIAALAGFGPRAPHPSEVLPAVRETSMLAAADHPVLVAASIEQAARTTAAIASLVLLLIVGAVAALLLA